jgi:hypothetical protein
MQESSRAMEVMRCQQVAASVLIWQTQLVED